LPLSTEFQVDFDCYDGCARCTFEVASFDRLQEVELKRWCLLAQ